ncbi:MAG: hypothetical protein HKO66_02970, partial [Saprospiraceae bacterium]|nr:hypothetical protein [Saprospiraceae bacterium]
EQQQLIEQQNDLLEQHQNIIEEKSNEINLLKIQQESFKNLSQRLAELEKVNSNQ